LRAKLARMSVPMPWIIFTGPIGFQPLWGKRCQLWIQGFLARRARAGRSMARMFMAWRTCCAEAAVRAART
jgi:hypothetical protein